MKDKIIVFSFLGYIVLFSLLHIVLPDNEISKTERRTLAHFPKIELSSEYITKVDEYLLDQFPFRDQFRSIKANFNYKILQKLDNNGIYLSGNYIFKSEYPTNETSVNSFITKTQKIESLLTDKNNVYMMIVPDKNYYLKDKNFLQLDYDYIYREVNKLNYQMIDIRDIMSLDDYYYTDTHWKQENLLKVIQELDKTMKFGYQDYEYREIVIDTFRGVYYGESALNRKPEQLTVLSNKIIDNVKINYLENQELDTVYNYLKFSSNDAYEVYLDGASAFIEIYNSNSTTDRELIVFRDSFGSSLTPLLIPYYAKITVVDNRYMTSDYINEYLEFEDQDVLFLYSTLIVNNSGSLKG